MRYTLLVASFLLLSNICRSQIISTVIDETALQFRVKQVDEFFQRFNYEVTYTGEKPSGSRNSEQGRKNLMTLFNTDKFMLPNHELDSLANGFMGYVLKNNIKIHYADTCWHAEARTSIVCDGKKHNATLILKTENIKDVIYHWVIADVQSPLFASFTSEPKGHLSISPAEHGVGFISVPESINLNHGALATAMQKGYKRDVRNVLDYLLTSGKAKFGPITKVLYRFNIGEYTFVLEHIEKEKGYNQGWLINSIDRNNK